MKGLFVSLSKYVLFCLALGFGHAAVANDAYREYMADLYQLESYQLREPKPVISYADSKHGALLKSVLSPDRFGATLDAYLQSPVSRDSSLPNPTQVIVPLLTRYDDAFKSQSKKYENEYLDSIEMLVLMMTQSSKATNQLGSKPASGKGKSEFTPEQQKKMDEAMEKMRTSLKSMNEAILKAQATALREKVSKGLFSPAGSKRALDLANRFSPAA